jgi:ankyrin repeat protein
MDDWMSDPIIIIAAITVTASLIGFFKKSGTELPNIMTAAHSRDLETFKKALKKRKLDLNVVDFNGFTPLIYAVNNFGQKYLIEEILEKGALTDIPDMYGNTALHYAVMRNKKALVKLLIENGADMELRNEKNERPIDIAISDNRKEIILLLQEKN